MNQSKFVLFTVVGFIGTAGTVAAAIACFIEPSVHPLIGALLLAAGIAQGLNHFRQVRLVWKLRRFW